VQQTVVNGVASRWSIIWGGQSWVVVTTTIQDWPCQWFPPTLWQLCEDKRRSVLSGDDDGGDDGGDYDVEAGVDDSSHLFWTWIQEKFNGFCFPTMLWTALLRSLLLRVHKDHSLIHIILHGLRWGWTADELLFSPGFKGGAGRIQPVSRAVPGEFCAFYFLVKLELTLPSRRWSSSKTTLPSRHSSGPNQARQLRSNWPNQSQRWSSRVKLNTWKLGRIPSDFATIKLLKSSYMMIEKVSEIHFSFQLFIDSFSKIYWNFEYWISKSVAFFLYKIWIQI
jgi:hypothetical protein